MNSQIDKYKDLILEILKKHDVKRASLFGSIVRKELTSESDIDLLIEFLGEYGLCPFCNEILYSPKGKQCPHCNASWYAEG